MKRSLLVVLLTITSAAAPLMSQNADGQRPKRTRSPVKVEMQKMEEALETVDDYLKKPEGDVPMAEIAAATAAVIEAKKHAPRAASTQPEDKRADFIKSYQIEMNKVLRGILDLEDALLADDLKAAEKVMKTFSTMERAGHKVFKPRRRRGSRSTGK